MRIIILFAACVAFAFCGCATSHGIYAKTETASESDNVRSLRTVSYEECLTVARVAIEDAMTSVQYANFLVQYKAENGEYAIPSMQIESFRNDTDDPDLNTRVMSDMMAKALQDTGKVKIVFAEGRNAKRTFADAHDLKYNKNKDSLNTPRLRLEGSISSQLTKEGIRMKRMTFFDFKIIDNENNEVIWMYNKLLGVQKTQPILRY